MELMWQYLWRQTECVAPVVFNLVYAAASTSQDRARCARRANATAKKGRTGCVCRQPVMESHGVLHPVEMLEINRDSAIS